MLVRDVEQSTSQNLHVLQVALSSHQVAVNIHPCRDGPTQDTPIRTHPTTTTTTAAAPARGQLNTFDEVRVQHLGLLELQDGVLGVSGPEVDVSQAHQQVHVVPQQ